MKIRCQNSMKNFKRPTKEGTVSCLKSNLLTIATFAGVIVGVVLGVILRASREEEWSKRDAMYVSFVGKLFLSALKSIIIPLVIPSLIIAIGTLDISLSGKIGGRAVAYYMSTTLVSQHIIYKILCISSNFTLLINCDNRSSSYTSLLII